VRCEGLWCERRCVSPQNFVGCRGIKQSVLSTSVNFNSGLCPPGFSLLDAVRQDHHRTSDFRQVQCLFCLLNKFPSLPWHVISLMWYTDLNLTYRQGRTTKACFCAFLWQHLSHLLISIPLGPNLECCFSTLLVFGHICSVVQQPPFHLHSKKKD
jgi:hypothetical protein